MSLIDKLGRKTLLLIGGVGMAFCLGGVGMVFFSGQHQSLLIMVAVAYIAFFAISMGAVIWVYISEVFPNRVRSKGQSLGSSTHWIMNCIISLIFPVIAQSLRRCAIRSCSSPHHDGGYVLHRAVYLSRDQGRYAGADATQAGNRVLRNVFY